MRKLHDADDQLVMDAQEDSEDGDFKSHESLAVHKLETPIPISRRSYFRCSVLELEAED